MFTHEEIWKSLLLRKLFWGKLYFAHLVHSISLGKTFLVFTLTTTQCQILLYPCNIFLRLRKKLFSIKFGNGLDKRTTVAFDNDLLLLHVENSLVKTKTI